jgi:hypothetical protein
MVSKLKTNKIPMQLRRSKRYFNVKKKIEKQYEELTVQQEKFLHRLLNTVDLSINA